MKEKSITEKMSEDCVNDCLDAIMDVLEKDDGRFFQEKKQEAMQLLRDKENVMLEQHVIKTAENAYTGKQYKEKFWAQGSCITGADGIVLRQVVYTDKEEYIKVRKEYFPVKHLLDSQSNCDFVWNEHLEDKSLMCTIEQHGNYVGYCGINNTTKEKWDISIELEKEYIHKGIGTIAITLLLDEIKQRLGVTEFYVQIDPENYGSQGLFEKLSAVPNGICEFLLHDAKRIHQCEEENLDLIDENLERVAMKFDVEPRILLSHVLEYKLMWDK